jgi:hypothetical protein
VLPCGFDGSFLCLSHEVFEFGEHLFDRIEIGTVGREEQEPCSGTLDDLPDRVALVTAEVVHDDNVAGVEASEQDLLDIALEALAVDRPVKHAGCRDPIASKGSQERMVFQWPCGTWATSLCPFRHQPRMGAMLVLVQVSSIKTSREGSIRLWYFFHQ